MTNKKLLKTNILPLLAMIALVLAVVISGCSSEPNTSENQNSEGLTVSRDEHEREGGDSVAEHEGDSGGEHTGEGGSEGCEGGNEESGATLALNETYDVVRNGARLILIYDTQSNAFNGTVENTANDTLKQVRVEVHLSNGIELGPTTPADLAPGEIMDLMLPATSQPFDGWTAHPEVGSGEGGGETDRNGLLQWR